MSEEVRLPGFPELRRRGFEALVRELGAANALRFLHRSRDHYRFRSFFSYPVSSSPAR